MMSIHAMRTRTAVIILAVIILGTGAALSVPFWSEESAAAPSSAPAGAALTKTDVVHYALATSSLPTKVVNGSCWTDSVAAPYRGDAWRCASSDAVYDPCFSAERSGRVVCGIDPVSDGGAFQLDLTVPLPKPSLPGEMPQTNWGWFVELGDGTYCTPFTAALPSVQGQTGYYGCTDASSGGRILLLGELNGDGPLWTAEEAVVENGPNGPNITSLATVPVKTVWQ